MLVNTAMYVILAFFCGGLLAGIGRKISARLQARVGPPVIQPFYDVLKLCRKENIVVRSSQNIYIFFFLLGMIFSAALFFSGTNIFMVIFALTVAEIFFVLGAFKASSPYSFIAAQRELLQMLAYEPALLLVGVGMYMVLKDFRISQAAVFSKPLFFYLPGLFFTYIFALVMRFRKSPFDLSMSHHAHQELVRGMTTEFSGRTLAMIEMAHWLDSVISLGFVYLFFAQSPKSGLLAAGAAYLAVVFIDNATARVRWQLALASLWISTLVLGVGNIIYLYFSLKLNVLF
jgi:formate hydrogenlyase subunit 4